MLVNENLSWLKVEEGLTFTDSVIRADLKNDSNYGKALVELLENDEGLKSNMDSILNNLSLETDHDHDNRYYRKTQLTNSLEEDLIHINKVYPKSSSASSSVFLLDSEISFSHSGNLEEIISGQNNPLLGVDLSSIPEGSDLLINVATPGNRDLNLVSYIFPPTLITGNSFSDVLDGVNNHPFSNGYTRAWLDASGEFGGTRNMSAFKVVKDRSRIGGNLAYYRIRGYLNSRV